MATPTTTLVILAGGSSSRFGGNKQLASVGPDNQALLDYTIYDGIAAGFSRVVVVTSKNLETSLSKHLESVGRDIPVEVCVQQAPSGSFRNKPWGTGHAVLAAQDVVSGPFAVCNADDFYGRSAFTFAWRHLDSPHEANIPNHALMAYQLDSTLDDTGGVSRGICEVTDGSVTSIAEITEIKRADGTITGRRTDGVIVDLSGDEPTSMNLWAFRPEVFASLDSQFNSFQDGCANDPLREFYLSEAIGDQIRRQSATLKCIPCPDDWFGMTYPNDLACVRHRIEELVNTGVYRWG